MSNTAPLSLFDRFELAIHGLKRSVADAFPLRTMPGMLIHMIFNRFARLNLEVQKLAAEIRAGKIRPELAPRMRAARKPVEKPEPSDPATPPKLRIPQDFGWLIKRIPYVAASHAEYFRKLLSEPEMVEMITVSGRMRGLLRPLCRALMIEPSYLEPRISPSGVEEESPDPPSCSSSPRGRRPGGGVSDSPEFPPELGARSAGVSPAAPLPQGEGGRIASGLPVPSDLPVPIDWEDWGSLGNYNSLDAPLLRIAAFPGPPPAVDPRPDDPRPDDPRPDGPRPDDPLGGPAAGGKFAPA